MKPWLFRALLSLSVAVSCAKATDEKLLDGGDDVSGGSSGGGTGGFGGTGFGGTATGGRGGTSGGTKEAEDFLRWTSEYKAGTKPVAEDPDGEFHLVNGTGEAIPLREFSFRYWFTSEFTCSETTSRMAVNVVHQQFLNPYAALAASSVTDRVVSLGTGAPGCDAYFEIGFTEQAGSLAAEQTAVVQYYSQIPIYEAARPKNQANDYSYGASSTAFVRWDKITVYRHGCFVSGREPGSGGEGGAGGENGGGMGGV